MRYSVKATIKTPPEWIVLSIREREDFLADTLREMAREVENGFDTRKTIKDRNGNTVAIEVKA